LAELIPEKDFFVDVNDFDGTEIRNRQVAIAATKTTALRLPQKL
jgi:hypothetical protein